MIQRHRSDRRLLLLLPHLSLHTIATVMTPPRWLDADGRPIPTLPCLRCRSPTPIFCLTVEDVRRNGWIRFLPATVVHWCGHGQEVIRVPGEDGRCELVLVEGEAW
jgi:hypothetical protein